MPIPSAGIHLFPTHHPRGFYVARYDAEGFANEGRWFDNRRAAEAYAKLLAEHP